MVSNQVHGARIAALLAVSLGLGACSQLRHHSDAQATAAAPPPVSAAPAAAPAPEVTATQAAIEAAGSGASAPLTAAAVNPTAPMRYTVKRGDTLWGISSMFLRDPWLWPEVWIINPQIPNPHRIYPGDVLALAYGADGRPQVSVAQAGELRLNPQLRSTPLDEAIPTIPYSVISAFLSRPTVLTKDQIRHSPYVLAIRDMHEVAGTGNEVYVRNLTAAENDRYAVVHVAGPLVDPDDGKVLGYEGIYTATALVQRPGDPAKAVLVDPARETLRGDRLLSVDGSETPLNFVLHSPSTDLRGRIVDVVGGTDLVGQYQVVVLNRGKNQGLEAGNVLAIDEAGEVVRDEYRNGNAAESTALSRSFARKVALPEERVGTLLVFRAFDQVSYGLVVAANDTIHVGDFVRKP
ncbi:MAG: LysM peptidoglycan-binding domain-containing protein [Proteobacteria bacterium]|nr:LysM peptidoglycan-binding domain-containing protein [Pseudomonadota bacterium]